MLYCYNAAFNVINQDR